ncbi:hypothetical protein HELRODRAFT_183781 [Helobdella robusta]|uniref:Rho guanine nucleotide exchange factor 6/7 coiled-coil domain-containing protein n=1 Tax=Helobdella robusta TaxID=6412 RepID=T1FK67_HELRO|nr:hypothetical protein HELRODRAFT_183781 [Helobdella robusta]ESO10314.1 hypothetical protein HELRODRAFT_183781 [Helobdella robusta]
MSVCLSLFLFSLSLSFFLSLSHMMCSEIRRRKEMEQDILSSDIRGWKGEGRIPTYGATVNALDDIVVATGVGGDDDEAAADRVVLEYVFEIIEKMTWLQTLKQPVRLGPANVAYKHLNKMNSPSTKHQLTSLSSSPVTQHSNPLPPPSSSTTTPQQQQQHAGNRSSLLFNLSQQKQQQQPQQHPPAPPLPLFTPSGLHHHQQQQQHNNIYATPQQQNISFVGEYNPNEVTLPNSQFYLPSFVSISNNNSSSSSRHPKKLNISNLRPYPPLRPSFSFKDDGARSPRFNKRIMGSSRKKPGPENELLLKRIAWFIRKVIEAYCANTKNRQAVNSSLFEHPQVLIAEEEKIILEDIKDDQIIVEEKTLVDTVYSLRDQIKDILTEQQLLRRDLEAERKARRTLEIFVRQNVKQQLNNNNSNNNSNNNNNSSSNSNGSLEKQLHSKSANLKNTSSSNKGTGSSSSSSSHNNSNNNNSSSSNNNNSNNNNNSCGSSSSSGSNQKRQSAVATANNE